MEELVEIIEEIYNNKVEKVKIPCLGEFLND